MTTIAELVNKIPPETRRGVEAAKNKFNNRIRDLLRRESGLMLRRPVSDSDRIDQTTIRVRLVEGIPKELKDVEFSDEEQLAIEIGQHRSALRALIDSTTDISPLLDRISNWTVVNELLGQRGGEIRSAGELAQDLLELADKYDPAKRIFGVKADVLGAYYPGEVRVDLYWGVIGLVGRQLGIAVEALTAVVLAHELAHAYSHVGMDIDGQCWDTDHFCRSEVSLKEGLAQYYTKIISLRLHSDFPEILDAFEELLRNQPEAYHTHEPWLMDRTPELVRLAMLEVRRQKGETVAQFEAALNVAEDRLGKIEPDIFPVEAPDRLF